MAPMEGFTPIQDLKVTGKPVDVIGVVVDYLPPSPTAGSDWQCTFNLADEHSSYEGQRVKVFAQRDKMPPIRGTGDVVILRQIQMKNYRGTDFLLFNFRTAWTVFHLDSIPWERPEKGDVHIPAVTTPTAHKPTKDDMSRAIELIALRSREEWTSKAPEETASGAPEPAPIMPYREKFSLIAGVGANKYFDLIGQVVKMYSTGDRMDLYITDYTENCLLYDYNAETAEGESGGRDGDEYSYLSSTTKKKEWKGPSGKYTLTVTLFWPHASHAQSKVRENDFVLLQNVHVKLGKNGSCRLEGVLHTDQKFPERVNVEKVSAENDDRVKELLLRKKYYQKEHASQLGGVEPVASKKRKSDDATSFQGMSKYQIKKAKQRQRKSEHKGEARSETSTRTELPHSETRARASKHAALEVNRQIACTHPQRPTRTIGDINDTDRSHVYTTPEGQRVHLPFINQLFRAKVRVVDFQPASLADFAVRTSEFDHLSDVDGDEDDNEDERAPSASPSISSGNDADDADADDDDAAVSRKRWTWFFTLIVQDAHDDANTEVKTHRDRLALHVADEDAEFLLGMEAVNLRRIGREQILHQLREKLFLLWGDLEERKTASAAERTALAEKEANPSATQQDAEQRKRKMKAQRKERQNLRDNSSLPFVCCVKEYGVEKSRGVWKRRFRLFGTSIQ